MLLASEPTEHHRRRRRVRRVAAAGLLLSAAGCAWYRVAARAQVHWQPPGGQPFDGTLHARLVGAAGPPIVLLHGFLGSGRSWGAELDRLGAHHRLIIPDLRGFGDSPKPAGGYSLDEHAEAVVALLDELGVREPAVLAGHSFGGLVALRLAALHPDRAAGIVAFGPPLYRDQREARRRIAAGDPMGGMLFLETPLARRACILFHEHPRAAAAVVRLLRPEIPPPVAGDVARHTWPSYSGTLEAVIATSGSDPAATVAAPVQVVIGEGDAVVDASYLREVAARHRHVQLRIVPGAGHDLPLTHPRLCRREIETLSPLPSRGRAGRETRNG